MDSIPYALFLYLISGKMQKSNVTSFLRLVLKKLARRLVRKKVKKFTFDHCKTCSERFVIWRDNFSFIFQRKEDKEISEKRCYTVQELQEIFGVSRPTIYNLMRKRIWIHRCMYSRKIIILLPMKSIRNFWQKGNGSDIAWG